jgi:hypothetical protein
MSHECDAVLLGADNSRDCSMFMFRVEQCKIDILLALLFTENEDSAICWDVSTAHPLAPHYQKAWIFNFVQNQHTTYMVL